MNTDRIQVGVKEFRTNLAKYLDNDKVIEILRRGQVVGEYRSVRCTSGQLSVHKNTDEAVSSVHSVIQDNKPVLSDKLSDNISKVKGLSKEEKLAIARQALADMGKPIIPLEPIEKPDKRLAMLGYVTK